MGYTLTYSVYFTTKNKTTANRSLAFNGGGYKYYTLPGAIPGDVYTAQANANKTGSDGHRRTVGEAVGFSTPASKNFTPPTPWPDPYTAPADQPLLSFGGLSPMKNGNEFVGYTLVYSWTGIYWQTFVSKAWLDSGTQYTMPDLTSLSGFANLKRLPGESYRWAAIALASNQGIGTIVHADMPMLYGFTGAFPLDRWSGPQVQHG